MAPQIIGFQAPEEVRPGQIVTIRMTTNYSPAMDIDGAAIVVEGVENWLKAEVVPEPAAASDDGAWLIYLPITIAGTADANAVLCHGPDVGSGRPSVASAGFGPA